MFLNVIMLFAGLWVLVYSFCEIRVWGSLYFDRNYFCIERFRSAQKATDLLSCLHNAMLLLFGFLLVAVALRRCMPENSVGFVRGLLPLSYALLLLDALAMECTVRLRGIRGIRDAIQAQWDAQKRVSPDNDHEVNMMRGAERVTRTYPRHVVIVGASLVLMRVFFL